MLSSLQCRIVYAVLIRAYSLSNTVTIGSGSTVAGDLDVGDTDRRQAVLAHGLAHQRAQLATELGGNAVSAMERLAWHLVLSDYSVRWTSMRSKHSIWSPGLTSL